MRVALKIVLLVLLVLLSVQSVLGALRIRRETRIVTEELERDHRILGAALVAAVERAEPDGLAGVERLLERIESAEGAVALDLRRGEGRGTVQRLEGGDLVTEIPARIGGEATVLVLRERLSEVDRVVSEGRRRLLGTGALLLLLGLAAAAVGGQVVVGRRLDRLVGRAEGIGRGELAPCAVPDGGDEIASLARALEALAAELTESRGRAEREYEARVATVEQLRHADRLRLVGDLAAGLAHELGSPLHVTAGNAELLQHDGALSDDAREIAGEIGAQARRMSGLVQRLLELAHPAPRGGAPSEVAALWEDLRSTAHGLTRGTAVELRMGDAPAGRLDLRPTLFVQALANLVRNAVQAQPDGGEVRVAGERDGDWVVIRVEDDGPGIPEALRDRIFSPFVTTKAPGQGVGLGLALADGVIEEAGGSLRLDEGPGARFVVRLPVVGGA